MRPFCDMDGVLADFDAGYERAFGARPDKVADNVDWDMVRATPNFYRDLPPMSDMWQLWSVIGLFEPVILTGVPQNVPEAVDNKTAWVRKHLGPDIEVRCCRSSEKWTHAKPDDVLIDDWEKYRDRWIKAGGVWITHRSAVETIAQLTPLLRKTA